MTELCCDLQIHINGQQTFFINQKMVSAYSGKLKKIVRKEKIKTTRIENLLITLEDFPGGGHGFELVSRFCYNDGRISITIPIVCTLHCAAIYLGMTEKLCKFNLLKQSDSFLEGMFYWNWGDIIVCLKSCEVFYDFADSCGLMDKLITTLLAKIAQNSDISLICSSNSSSSSPSSPDNTSANKPLSNRGLYRLSSSNNSNNYGVNNNSAINSNNNKAWWFDDLATLCPMMIEKVLRSLGAFGSENNSLLMTRFLLHYLKTHKTCSKSEYIGLADTAVYGVILMGKTAFSCRALFWVLRLVSGSGISKVCRSELERLIGSMLDLAKLDDLLVSGGQNFDGVYDVNLVVRLIRVFVQFEGVSTQRLQVVGWLVDQYLAEISPDHNLKISKFIDVAQSLPDFARDCFDGVYRAIDIYLESHPSLSSYERSRLCGCLSYDKLSLEACKDLASNPRIPPRVAVEALASQKHVDYHESPTKTTQLEYYYESPSRKRGNVTNKKTVPYRNNNHREMADHEEKDDHEDEDEDEGESGFLEENEDHVKLNIQRMQWRVIELEKLCTEMKGQMTKLVKNNKTTNSPRHSRQYRLC